MQTPKRVEAEPCMNLEARAANPSGSGIFQLKPAQEGQAETILEPVAEERCRKTRLRELMKDKFEEWK